MPIYRNEFDDYSQAIGALTEFPYCGTCPAPLKLAQIDGRFLLLCQDAPVAHFGFGIKRKAYTSQQKLPSSGFVVEALRGSWTPTVSWSSNLPFALSLAVRAKLQNPSVEYRVKALRGFDQKALTDFGLK